jgi:hypothetical protein
MKQPFSTLCLAIAAYAGLNAPLLGSTLSFRLLGDPGQNYTFARSDSPVGTTISDPVAPTRVGSAPTPRAIYTASFVSIT